MIHYLGYFSKSFTFAIMMWPVVSLILTLPILAFMYHRQHRMRFLSAAAAYLAVLYFVGLAAFTFYPMPDDPQAFCAAHVGSYKPQLNLFKFISDIQYGGQNGVLQLVMNVVLFLPLGFILFRWARWPWWVVIIAGFCTSLFIESSQLTGFWGVYPCAYRQFDVDDLLTNTSGAILGLGIAELYGLLVPERALPVKSDVNTNPGLVHRAVTFIIDMLFIGIIYYPLTAALIMGFYKFSTPEPNGEFLLFGHFQCNVAWLTIIAPVIAMLAFLIFEVIIPAAHRGQTLGGMFTHMTVESQERHGWRRLAFYVVRTLILGAAVLCLVLALQGHKLIGIAAAVIVVALYMFFAVMNNRFPWDCVSSKTRGKGSPTDTTTDSSAAALDQQSASAQPATVESAESAALPQADDAAGTSVQSAESAVLDQSDDMAETAVQSAE